MYTPGSQTLHKDVGQTFQTTQHFLSCFMPVTSMLKDQHRLVLFIFRLLKVKVLVAQLCLTFCDHMDCSPPGASVYGILKARILEWIAVSFSSGSS